MHIVLTGQEDKLSVWGSRISQMQDKCHQFHVLLFVFFFSEENSSASVSLKQKSFRIPLWIVIRINTGEGYTVHLLIPPFQ